MTDTPPCAKLKLDIGGFMNDIQCREFLNWLLSRLKLKYNENDEVLNKLNYIIQNKKLIDYSVSVKFINHLCNKHYPGFDFEKTETMDIGYTNHERKEIYNLVSSVIIDTINAQS